MRIAEAQQELRDGVTLVLEYTGNMYYRARYDGKHFLLDFVKVGKILIPLAKEAEWDSFYEKVPHLVKGFPDWLKQSAQDKGPQQDAQRNSHTGP